MSEMVDKALRAWLETAHRQVPNVLLFDELGEYRDELRICMRAALAAVRPEMIRSDADAIKVLREIHRIVLSVYPIPDGVAIDPAVAFVLGEIGGLAASILKRLPEETMP